MTDQKTSALPSLLTAFIVAGLAVLVGFAAVYVTVGGSDNIVAPGDPVQIGTKAVKPAAKGADTVSGKASGKASGAGGDLSAFVTKTPAAALADVTFEDGAGKALRMSDFRGKTVLLNLWATWCAPCKAEMPSLDRLQSQLGSDTFQVVALALDRKGTKAAQAFLDQIKTENLQLYIDPSAKAGPALKVTGMPTTILINPEGLEIGRLVGPAEWDSKAAIKLITEAMR